MSEIDLFLETVYGPKREEHYILLWEKLDHKVSYWFQDWKEAAQCAAEHRVNIYSGVNLAPQSYGAAQRCKAADIIAQTAVIADLDIAGPAHADRPLPPTIEAARYILPPELKPTILIFTGHGLQAWWCFKEPTVFETAEEREGGAALSHNWWEVMNRRAIAKGWKLDAVYDLARVLRIPDTTNHKEGIPDTHARILEISGERYNPRDIQEYLEYVRPEAALQRRALTLVPPTPGAFVYDPNAKANPVIFQALWSDMNFRLTWRKLRPEMAGKTQSEWDMALANILWSAQLPDQEAVNFLIHYRRMHGGRPHNNPPDYLQRTLRRARDRDYRQPEASAETLTGEIPAGAAEEFIDAKIAPAKAEPPPEQPLPEQEKDRLALLNETLKVTINDKRLAIKEIDWVRGTEQNTRWRIIMEDGQIVTLTHASHYLEISNLRNAFAGQLNATLGVPNKKTDWLRFGSRLFQACCTEVSAGENNNIKGDTRDLLERYFRAQAILPGPLACWENLENMYAPVVHNGQIAVHAAGICEHFWKRHHEHLNKGDVINGLSALGSEGKRMNGPRGKSQHRYYLPAAEWKPEDYIEEERADRTGERLPDEGNNSDDGQH